MAKHSVSTATKTQSPLQHAAAILQKGDYRMAELMLSDIAKSGDQRSAVHINWALAVLYQFRWWEGACQLYNTVGSAPDSDRQRLAGTLAKGLEAQASLWEKRGLTGDAADLRKLAASFLPWPEGPVVFAARWLPELTAANRDPAMMRFAEWCRLGEFTDPLRQDDLARLFGAAIDSPAAYLPPMLVEGLMRNIATLPESPLVWTEAVIKSMKNTAQIRPFLGIPLHEQITNHAGIMMHAKLSGFIANGLLSGDSHYEPSALAAWQAFGEKVMPDREPVAWDAHIAARRYDTYDIEGGDLAWSTLSANQDAIRSTRDWDLEELFANFGSLAFLVSRRDVRLATKQLIEKTLSAELLRRFEADRREKGLQPPVLQTQPLQGRPLRVGYMTCFAYRHSMAYLLNAMLAHHGSDVDSYLYDTALRAGSDDLAQSLRARAKHYRHVPVTSIGEGRQAAQKIADDGIDILVDLDGVTNQYNSLVHMFHPATASCTLAGADSLGDPNVDFFLADRFCLGDDAQDYYVERIWRSEGCIWISDGYHDAIDLSDRNTLRRDLGLAQYSVVYLVAAPGNKITRELAEDAMHILADVPDSALLIKGKGNLRLMRRFWHGQAKQLGIDTSRLHILPYAPSQEAHRAQLQAADVFLDTHPYSGGSHTLETLWLGIPTVTRYGETSYSRMSYSMLRHLGVTATIAESREGYRAIAVQLGLDHGRRQTLRNQLLAAAADRTGLWDTPRMVAALEKAYREMVQARLDQADAGL